MPDAISVNKKSRGRPATGQDQAVSVRLPRDVIERADAIAKASDLTRSEVIRRVVIKGLPVDQT